MTGRSSCSGCAIAARRSTGRYAQCAASRSLSAHVFCWRHWHPRVLAGDVCTVHVYYGEFSWSTRHADRDCSFPIIDSLELFPKLNCSPCRAKSDGRVAKEVDELEQQCSSRHAACLIDAEKLQLAHEKLQLNGPDQARDMEVHTRSIGRAQKLLKTLKVRIRVCMERAFRARQKSRLSSVQIGCHMA